MRCSLEESLVGYGRSDVREPPAAAHGSLRWCCKLRKMPRALPLTALVCLLAPISAPPAVARADLRWPDAERVVAIADVHGAYDAMCETLRNAGVIDESASWSGGRAHLVIVGDLLDRGPDSRAAMDLVMRLEAEAEEAGGRVHMLLGNHEIMNLVGDLRYVSVEEYAAFDGEEEAALRQLEFEKESAAAAVDRDAFDRRFPSGYFAHRAAFRADGKYGKWLLSKPVLITVNGTAFVHGGLAEMAAKLGVEGLNSSLRAQLHEYLETLQLLTDAGLLNHADAFYDHPQRLEAILQETLDDVPQDALDDVGQDTLDEKTRAAAARLIELNQAPLFNPDSPIWFRGSVRCSAVIEDDRLGSALAALDADRLVVGHTPTPNGRVLSRLGGQVLRIDTGMLNSYYGGRGAALILAGSDVAVVYEDKSARLQPEIQPRRVGRRPRGLSVEQLEKMLTTGEIVVSDSEEGDSDAIKLVAGDIELQARFSPSQRGGVLPELAAYKLDRLLALDMVPVTVARTVSGQAGALQFIPADAMSEEQRMAARGGGDAWCPLRDQFNAMYVFDALILNEGRTPDSMLYDPMNWQLMLTRHDQAFGTRKGQPEYQRGVSLEVGQSWVARLNSLDEETLEGSLGDSLGKSRLKALMKRRDELIKNATK